MAITQMSQEECRDLLVHASFGRLACVRKTKPYVVPIYFAYERDRIYGFATLGQKIEWMRSNPHVCLEVDDVQSHLSWRSVIVTGRYEEIPDTPGHSNQRLKAQKLLEQRYCGGILRLHQTSFVVVKVVPFFSASTSMK